MNSAFILFPKAAVAHRDRSVSVSDIRLSCYWITNGLTPPNTGALSARGRLFGKLLVTVGTHFPCVWFIVISIVIYFSVCCSWAFLNACLKMCVLKDQPNREIRSLQPESDIWKSHKQCPSANTVNITRSFCCDLCCVFLFVCPPSLVNSL